MGSFLSETVKRHVLNAMDRRLILRRLRNTQWSPPEIMTLIHKILVLAMCTLSVGLWAQTPSAKTAAAKTKDQSRTETIAKPMNRQVNADDQLQMLSRQLDLTKAQQARIKPILEHNLQQMRQIEMNDKLSDDEKSARLQSSEHSSHSKIRALLTIAQKKRFDHIMGTDNGRSQPPSKAQKTK